MFPYLDDIVAGVLEVGDSFRPSQLVASAGLLAVRERCRLARSHPVEPGAPG